MRALRALAALFAVLRLEAGLAEPIAGPFRMIWDRSEKCPPEFLDMPFDMFFRATRNRRNLDLWIVNANVTTVVPFDDHLDVTADFSSWSSRGGWKPHAVVLKFPRICSSLKTYLPDTFRSFITASKGPGADCPQPPGVHQFPNVTTELKIKQFTHFFYGRWRVDFKVLQGSKCALCARVLGRTVPLRPASKP